MERSHLATDFDGNIVVSLMGCPATTHDIYSKALKQKRETRKYSQGTMEAAGRSLGPSHGLEGGVNLS